MEDPVTGRGLPLIQFWEWDEAPAHIREFMRKSASCEWAALVPAELSRTEIADFLAGAASAMQEIRQADGSLLILGGHGEGATLASVYAAREQGPMKRKRGA